MVRLMITSRTIRRLIIPFGVGTLICGMAPDTQAASGTWNTTTSGAVWTLDTNWVGSVIADGSDNTADFSQVDLTADTAVDLTGTRTIGNLVFGDTNTATGGSWLMNGGTGALTLVGAAPTITVNALGTEKLARLNTGISGVSGFTKNGAGTLLLASSGNSLSGPITLSTGAMQLNNTSLTNATSVAINSGTLVLATTAANALGGTISFGGGFLQFNVAPGTDYSAQFSTSANQAYKIITGVSTTFGSNLASSGGSLQVVGNGNLTLSAANTFNGTTTVSTNNGNLILSNALALQNSAIDATNSVTGTTTQGLVLAGVTTPTFGGLIGTKALSTLFNSSTGGYGSVTNLTLNPGTGKDYTYAGAITDGVFEISLTKSGAGTQALSGDNTYTGATTITSGILRTSFLANGGSTSGIGASGNAAANLVINGGTLQYSGSDAASTDRSFTVGTAGATIDASGTGAGALTITGSPTWITNAATTTLNLSGNNMGANTFSGTLSNINAAGGLVLNKIGAGAWTLGGNGSSTLAKGRIYANGGTLNFGSATEAPTLTISAQAGADNSGMTVNTGNFNMKAGNLTVNNMAYGLILNTSTYTQTGGTYSTNAIIGFANNGGSSTVNISGGSFTTTNATVNATNLAVRGTTTVNLSGTGTFTAPTLNMSTNQIGSGGATSTFNLDGGTLVAGRIIKGTGGSTGTQTFNFNGGTLKSSASSTTYMTGLTNTFVKAGGVIIDTQAFNVTIGQNLLTDAISTGGGLTKSGSGTLTLTGANTYTGTTTVNDGALSLGDGTTNTSLADTAAVVIGTDPATILYLNYIGTDTIASLTINGVAKPAGVYSSSDPSGLINGTGTLTVLTGPASPYITWANSFLPGNNVSDPAGDNDNDGLVNLQEFGFGLDPTSGSSFNPITVQLNETTGQFSYQRRAGSGLTYKILTSTTNATGSWTENITASQVAGATNGNGNQTVVVTLTGAPLAEPLFVRVTAAETPAQRRPINVKDFGAKGDGVTDDTAAINAAIVAAKRQVAGAIVSLPSGRYKTALGTEKSILITGADGLTFQGEGDTTIVSGDLDAPVFRLVDSKSVTVRKISIDHDPLGYTQGTITSVDIPNMTCEVSIDPGYPAPNDPLFKGSQVHPFVFPEKNYYQLDRYWPNPVEMVKTGEHTWSWKLQGPPNIENWPGKRFFIYTESRSHAFILTNLRDTTLEDVNYWGGGANAGFYIRGLEGTTTFRRFVIGVPPGSNRLYSCAGGGQVSGLRGKLLLDQCDFSKIDDDGIDILSNYTRVIEQRDARTLEVQAKNSDYRTGDRVELWDWQHKKIRSEAIITTATSTPAGTFVITLDRDVVTERVGVGVGMNFSRESMTDGIDRLINVATVGQETIIRDSKFQVFRAKCLNLKAANCTIERCTFSNSFQPAISAAPEWYFEEGSSIRNLTVRDCTFTDNNHANIDIGASPLSGVPGTPPVVSDDPENISHDSTNILIENNTFSGFGTTPSVFQWNWPVGPAISITNAAQVVIRGNTFGPLAASAPNGTPTILVEKSNDVQIMDNQGISSATSWLAAPTDANWATDSSWNSASAPGDLLGTNTNADTATFNATVTNGFGTTSPVVIDAGRNLKNITFSTAAAGAYVIGTTGGNALLLSSGGTIQTVSGVVNVQTVNAPLVLQPASATTAGTYTFSSNAASANNVLNFGGAISTGVTTSTQTLTLTGNNTGANTLIGGLGGTNAASGLILNKTGAGAWTLGGNGSSTLAKGRLTVSAGTLNFGSATEAPTLTVNAQAGADNSGMNVNGGTFNMKAGNLTVNNMAYGLILNTSTYTQTGGAYSTNGIIGLANNGGSSVSTVNISGGSFITTNATVNAINLAVRGTSIFNLSGTGSFTAPTLNMSTNQIGSGGATSTFNLDGGTLVAGQIIKGTGGSTGTQTFNFNGGTLRSSANSTTYMTGLTNAFVKAGGVIIDTQAFNVTIGQDLLTDTDSTGGGLTKSGSGTLALTGANAYTGTTTITAGTLQVVGSLSGGVTVEAPGTLAPGLASGIGSLTLASPLTVAGKLSFRIDRSNPQNADLITAPSLALTGVLSVNNIGPALQAGDSFKLFDISGSFTQSQVTFSLPSLSNGLMWDAGSLLTTGTLKVVAVNSSPVGDTAWPGLLPLQIQAVKQAGNASVTINPGIYQLPDKSAADVTFDLNGWTNFTIDATGVTLVVGKQRTFQLTNCSNVTITGCTIRARYPSFTQGRVLSKGTNPNGTVYAIWKISDGYPTTFAIDTSYIPSNPDEVKVVVFNAVNQNTRLIDLETGDHYGTIATAQGNNTWKIDFSNTTALPFIANDWLVTRLSNADKQLHAVRLDNSTNCTLQSLTSQGGGFASVFEAGGGGNRLWGYRIECAPDAPVGGTETPVVSSAADGVHTVATYPGLDVKDCVFTGVFLDDCIAIHGYFSTVLSAFGTIVTMNGYGHFVVGDPVRFSDTAGFFAQATCTAVANPGNGTVQVTLDQTLAVPAGAKASNPKFNGSGFRIINCQLGNTRSRGIITKADDGLISGCTISHSGIAINIGLEYYWNESDYCWNNTVVGNLISDCVVGVNLVQDGAIGNRNLSVIDNSFSNITRGNCIYIDGCDGATISGNSFPTPTAAETIRLDNSANITLANNLVAYSPGGMNVLNIGSSVTSVQGAANGMLYSGRAYALNNSLSGLLLAHPSSNAVGTTLQQYSNSNASSRWILQPDGNGHCKIVSAANGLVVGVNQSSSSAAPLTLETSGPGQGQRWKLTPVGTSAIKLVNQLSGFAATVQTASLAETVTQLADTSAAGQLWTPAFDDYTYSTWSAAVGAGADPMSDDDQDGINNLLEYALASDPASAGGVTSGNIISTTVEGQPVDYLTLACQRRVAATDITFQVEYSTDLTNWQTNAVLVSSTPNPDGTTSEVWRSPPLAGSASGFLRVRVKTED